MDNWQEESLVPRENTEHYFLKRDKKIKQANNLFVNFFQNKSPNQVRCEIGTALGGIRGVNGRAVVLAADGQMSWGNNKDSMEFPKIFQVDKYTAVAVTGTMNFIQEIIKIFEIELFFHQAQKQGRFLSPDGKANLLSNLVKQIMDMSLYFGFGIGFLMAVYDPKEDVAQLFRIGCLGTIIKNRNVLAEGSGCDWVLGVLDKDYKEKGGITIPRQSMIKLAKQAIDSAIIHDLYCGGKKLVYFIDKHGVRRIK